MNILNTIMIKIYKIYIYIQSSYYCYNRYFVLTIYFNLSKRFMKGNANQQSNEQENGPDNSQRVPANIQMVSNVEQPIQYPLQRILNVKVMLFI